MSAIKNYQEQLQEIVEKAISAVEEQHKTLASKSFGYAEKLYNLESLKEKHDEVSSVAYEKVREVNKRVNDFASDLIARFDKEEETVVAKAKTQAKKTATAAKKKATATKTAAKKVAEKVEEATA